MWQNHWDCAEHGKIDHRSLEFVAIASDPVVIRMPIAVDFAFVDIKVDTASGEQLDKLVDQHGIKRK